MANTLHVEVVSAEAKVFSGEAEFVVLPGEMSELGIYPRHAPLLSRIRPGEVRIRIPGQVEEEVIFVAGGILEVQPTEVTVMADSAVRSADADEAKALQAKKEAEAVIRAGKETTYFEFVKAESELAVALLQLQRLRTRGRGSGRDV